jgi:hypothetical protein
MTTPKIEYEFKIMSDAESAKYAGISRGNGARRSHVVPWLKNLHEYSPMNLMPLRPPKLR